MLWSAAGLASAPPVLRRMGRRESGSGVAAARAGDAAGDMSAEAVYNRNAMLRSERGISRRDLADALGVHHQTVGYIPSSPPRRPTCCPGNWSVTGNCSR